MVKTLAPELIAPRIDTPPPDLVTATAQTTADDANLLARVRAFAEPLLADQVLDSGENTLEHADAMVDILASVGASASMKAGGYLVYASEHLNKPREVITRICGPELADLAIETGKLVKVQRLSRAALPMIQTPEGVRLQNENVRKMLLAFSRDLRVVMLRLASRLQTLRYAAATRKSLQPSLARETREVFAPLANRLGVWQIKWEMEDLLFRALEPDTYKLVASMLDEKRVERELSLEALRKELQGGLMAAGIPATVQGRPKHIYSIVKKMRGKQLDFDQVFDVRALRVVVNTVDDCYAALDWVNRHFTPVSEEFDDYIAKPKPNGYQSLHTVVRDAKGKPMEIQIRTKAMHDHAEHGVAAHWAYKEAGSKGYGGAVTADSSYDAKIAVLRQLLAWERDLAHAINGQALFDDRIYVLTPDAAVIELPRGATPVDFAYSVHTSVGHRCRGAKVDGKLVALNTPLENGQSVEIVTAKEGGPSMDWLDPEQGYLVGQRAKAKVRAWFNAQHAEATVARGRDMVEKLLQREGKTAIKYEDLARELGFKTIDALFEVVGKDELSLRTIEALFKPDAAPHEAEQDVVRTGKPRTDGRGAGVLVVGVGSLLTHLARCCRPAPPDEIGGFVTRGKGVSIHRLDCASFHALGRREPERVIEVDWGQGGKPGEPAAVYPVDISVEAADRQGLLRDISDVFSKERINVIGVQTHSARGTAWMTFTVELQQTGQLVQVLNAVRQVKGVRGTRRM
ncbi:GTP pyrophosphokinase [Comamonas serinivorans]|uniref:GTP pyrophosphokinase n=1 Tax=Comamonas serinivorans TaxID=1082851 RepID=A0A1Y0EQH4_9BURK|nr:bifunctional (p)ppGpp synthetase/guanosine-3',5'-bis(diphosphate) 3'-pyrophosphohydrolase [Comamonas serinivorans]ARU05680.1 GTP pyrophosphokinase [Comamonas serinivorans]